MPASPAGGRDATPAGPRPPRPGPPAEPASQSEVAAPAEKPSRMPRVDPRIEARREAVEQSRDRGRVRLYAIASAVLVTAALAVGALYSPLFAVRQVEVEGSVRTGSALVRDTAQIEVGSPLVSVDAGAVRRRLEALPWVASVAVQRRWPGTVRVRLTERRAVVAVSGPSQGWAVVDATGRVLEHTAARPNDLVAVVGGRPPAPGAAVDATTRAGIAVATRLDAQIMPFVARVVARRDDLRVVLAGETGEAATPKETTVLLGRATDLGAKTQALLTMVVRLGPEELLDTLRTIDLRVPDAPMGSPRVVPTTVPTSVPTAPSTAPPSDGAQVEAP